MRRVLVGAGEEVWKQGNERVSEGGREGASEGAGKEYRRWEMLSGVVQSSHRI